MKIGVSLGLTMLLGLSLAGAQTRPDSPFGGDGAATREFFKTHCDYIAAEQRDNPILFRAGYYMRTLVAGYEIFGDRKYLDLAIAGADKLLGNQLPSGYWPTGYGAIFLADTGSMIGLFIALDRHVDEGRRGRYLEAVRRYVTAVEADGFINPSGGIGVGWSQFKDGQASGKNIKEYTVSSGLSAPVFTWMYQMTREEKYRVIARNALRWVVGTFTEDGRIPYIFAGYSDPGLTGNFSNDYWLWDHDPNTCSAYVGEGIVGFDVHCGNPEWQNELRAKIKPHIEWLLRTQRSNGTWGIMDSHDQKRSPLIINFLSWYYRHVSGDARIVRAIRRYDEHLRLPENAKFYGMMSFGAGPRSRTEDGANDILTAIVGLSIAEIISPGIWDRW